MLDNLPRPGLESDQSLAPSLLESSHHVQRHDGRRSLPDRQDLDISEEAGQARVLDVSLTTETLQALGHHGHGRLGCVELGHGGQES